MTRLRSFAGTTSTAGGSCGSEDAAGGMATVAVPEGFWLGAVVVVAVACGESLASMVRPPKELPAPLGGVAVGAESSRVVGRGGSPGGVP